VEQLTLLPKIHNPATALLSVLALTWPPLSLVTAILIDICMQVARKRNLSRRTLSLLLGGAVLIGCFPFVVENPTAIVDTLANLSPLGIVLSIALIFPAIYGGMRLGQNIGETMSVSER
jgi:SNF family Na+-dependent transporter